MDVCSVFMISYSVLIITVNFLRMLCMEEPYCFHIFLAFISDHQLQLDAQISLQAKKKSSDKRITGFQVANCKRIDFWYFFRLITVLSFESLVLNSLISIIQYCPSDPRKLLVTSADSQIRILDGIDVVSKYKGIKELHYFSQLVSFPDIIEISYLPFIPARSSQCWKSDSSIIHIRWQAHYISQWGF